MVIIEDEIKALFIEEYNKLNKKATIEDAKLVRDELCNTAKLENEKAKLIKEKERIEDANNKLIFENSEKAIDQNIHNEKRKE